MRSAPAVQVVVGADAVWRVGTALCCAAAAATSTAWFGLIFELTAVAAGAVALLAAALAAWLSRAYLRSPVGTLSWDGDEWRWAEQPGDVRAVLDVGPWLLLAFTPAGLGRRRIVHLPVSRAGARTGWHGLRAAVYSRRPEPRTPSALRM